MSSLPESDWRWLVRYLSGGTGPWDAEELQAWIVEDADRARLMDELQHVWEATGEPAKKRDVQAAWQRLSEELDREELDREERGREERGREERPPPAARRGSPAGREDAGSHAAGSHAADARRPAYRARRHSARSSWRSMAALTLVIVTCVGGLFAALHQSGHPGEASAPPAKTFTTEAGQRATVELTDGTHVQLNAGSQLTLSPAFAEGRRTVRLEGEAYFEVASDSTHPFRVQTEDALVEVRGTAFNVRAYATEEQTQVAVAEGQVALRSSRPPPAGETAEEDAAGQGGATRDSVVEATVLGPRHLGAVSDRGVQTVSVDVALAPYLAWTEGKLVFEDASFGEVVRQLERWYGLHINARVPPGKVERLNATFDREPLAVVLKTITAALDLKYTKEGRQVTFFSEAHVTPSGPDRPPTSTSLTEAIAD